MSRAADRMKRTDDSDTSITLRDSATGAPITRFDVGVWLMFGNPPSPCLLERIMPDGRLCVLAKPGVRMDGRCEIGDKGKYKGVAMVIDEIQPAEAFDADTELNGPTTIPGALLMPKVDPEQDRDRVYLRVVGFTTAAIRGKKAKKAYKRAKNEHRRAKERTAEKGQGDGGEATVQGQPSA